MRQKIGFPIHATFIRVSIFVLIGICSCEPSFVFGNDAEHFEARIRPALVAHCYSCHSASSGKSEGGLQLDTGLGLRKGGDSGPAIVPGEPSKSLVISALKYQSIQMPPTGKLDESIIQAFEKWIQDGAVDPRESISDSMPNKLAPVDVSKAKDHWAFLPLPHFVPIPTNSTFPETSSATPIDSFIESQYEIQRLSPVGQASRETWLRRVTFDLVGLPPSVEEFESFMKDAEPDAYERVVDRLLASQHYGERWGRYWLDLARYADSNGADENHSYPSAWRYRDYVISSFNSDKPYDEFVTEQLAGDLLAAKHDEHRRELLTATGFLVIGPKMLAEQDKPKLVTDIVDEQVDTVGKVFLGLTLGCARCHDHKFDPITAKDYYSLAGIFHSTKTMEHLNHVSQWNERDLPDPLRTAEVLAYQPKIDAAKESYQKLQMELKDSSLKANEKKAKLDEAKKTVEEVEKQSPKFDKAMSVDESPVKLVAIHVRGSHQTMLGEPLPRAFPQAIVDCATHCESNCDNNRSDSFSDKQSGRLELSRWLTGEASFLTSRVMVNRIWQGHLGEGLVRSASNFGFQSESPSHAQLLDWLAREFIDSGWSIKSLHRLIVLSSTYRLDSRTIDHNAKSDPSNRFLWRQNRRRLELEPLRDSLLAASGELDRKVFGQSQAVYGNEFPSIKQARTTFGAARRTVYLPINRAALDENFATFDYVEPGVSLEKRPSTTVPHQTLFLLNHPLPLHSASLLAQSIVSEELPLESKLSLLYEKLFSRKPSPAEIAAGKAFLERNRDAKLSSEQSGAPDQGAGSLQPHDAWASYCRALILTNEFLYVD